MRLPGVIELGYLAVMLVIIPRGAIRSRRILGDSATTAGQPELTRRQILLQSILTLTLLGVMTGIAAWAIDYDPLHRPARFGTLELLIGAGGLAITGLAGWLSGRVRTPAEREKLAIYRWMPQTGVERALFVVSALLAGTVEEAAYRGVLVTILAGVTGSAAVGALVSALAFAVGHAVQGWKSGVVVFAMALLMQAIVALTGTLLIAMAVHALYDIVAGIRAGNTARRLAEAPAAPTGS